MNRREYLLSAASALMIAAASGARAATGEAKAVYSPQINYRIRIPMRDGVHLGATLYLPRGLDTPRPTIFSHTPYTADLYHPEGAYFSTRGYPYLAVDMRGRGDSEGEFAPFGSEVNDGHDIVDWIAKQPFCNGKVAGNGHSWVGYTQWAAVHGGAKLATIVPLSSPWVGLDFPINNNIFYAFAVPWLTHVDGHTQRNTMMKDGAFQVTEQLRFIESGLPFRKMDEFYGIESRQFREWVSHPSQDGYWDRRNPTDEQLAGLTMPVLTMCGYFDGDQPGALEFYRRHQRFSGGKADHYLVLGPWGHDQVRKPEAEFFGIKVGESSVIDALGLHADWFAFTMEDGPRPAFLQKKVAYYVMGADKWRYADTLGAVTARHDVLYLGSGENPVSAYRAGTLAPKPAGKDEPDHYIYDPRDLGALLLELSQTQSHLVDQTALLTDTADKLVYQSAPFEKDTEVSGVFKFAAWIAIDQPDTDFLVSIHDIAPDGTSMFLTDTRMRARYREGLRTEKLIDTKAPLRYDFDRFTFVSRLIKAGNRLRLVIRANQSVAWQRNYNSGKPVADETMADARTVTVRLFHDSARPSALSIPVGQPDS